MSTSAKVAILLTLQGASQFQRALFGISSEFRDLRGRVSQAGADLFHWIEVGKSVAGAAIGIGRSVAGVAQSIVKPNISLDEFKESLANTGMAADAAEKKYRELFRTAGDLGLGVDETLAAYAALRKFDDGAQATTETLGRVSRASKYSSAAPAEIAAAFGDLWDRLKQGKDFDMAARSLLHYRLISGETLTEIGKMAEGGADIADIWGRLTQAIDQTTRHVGSGADTWKDITQRIGDYATEAKRLAGLGLFRGLKEDMGGLKGELDTLFQTGRYEKLGAALSKEIAGIYDQAKAKFGGGLTLTTVFDAAEAGKLGDLLTTVVKGAGSNFGVALRNAAVEYGPVIQAALIPQRLHAVLGISPERTETLRRMEQGTATPEEKWNNLGIAEKAGLGYAYALQGGKKGMRGVDTAYAEHELEAKKPQPFVDIAAQIAALKIQPKEPLQAKPQPVLEPGALVHKFAFSEAMTRVMRESFQLVAEPESVGSDLTSRPSDIATIVRSFRSAQPAAPVATKPQQAVEMGSMYRVLPSTQERAAPSLPVPERPQTMAPPSLFTSVSPEPTVMAPEQSDIASIVRSFRMVQPEQTVTAHDTYIRGSSYETPTLDAEDAKVVASLDRILKSLDTAGEKAGTLAKNLGDAADRSATF